MNILSQILFKKLENYKFIDNKKFIMKRSKGHQENSRY